MPNSSKETQNQTPQESPSLSAGALGGQRILGGRTIEIKPQRHSLVPWQIWEPTAMNCEDKDSPQCFLWLEQASRCTFTRHSQQAGWVCLGHPVPVAFLTALEGKCIAWELGPTLWRCGEQALIYTEAEKLFGGGRRGCIQTDRALAF